VIDRALRICALTLSALVVAASQAQQTDPDWLIVPGERVGFVTAETTDASLKALFGASNVESVDVYLGEGFTSPGTAVYPSDTTRRIEVVWSDETRTVPKEVRLTGDSSVWRTAEGISLGSTLREIERLNGYPFRLVGFAFDYGGTIVDCGRGRLVALGCSVADERGASKGRLMVVRLNPGVDALGTSEYRQVLGEREFSSGHPAMQKLNPRVYQLIVFIAVGGGV